MDDNDAMKFMDGIEKLVNMVLEEKLSNVLMVYPARVQSVATNGLTANIRLIDDNTLLSNIPVYNTRTIVAGDSCYVGYWGSGGKRMNNITVLFGGTQFR